MCLPRTKGLQRINLKAGYSLPLKDGFTLSRVVGASGFENPGSGVANISQKITELVHK
jgi:hypothetical protein